MLAVLTIAHALGSGALAHADTATSEALSDDGAAAQAKLLFDQGVAALASERWLEAEALFRRSAEIVPRSSSLYNLALALFELRRYAECVEISERVLSEGNADEVEKVREPAARLRERSLAYVAVVLLAVDPADASVTVDGGEAVAESGAQRKLLLPSGVHRVSASAPGKVTEERVLALKAGDQTSLDLILAAPPQAARAAASAVSPVRALRTQVELGTNAQPPRPAPTPYLPWFVGGAGALALTAGLITGLMANAADNDFTDRCGGTTDCDPKLKPLAQKTERLALATDILLATGAGALGIGITLWLLNANDASVDKTNAKITLRGFGAQLRVGL
jgi:hypothetical protein